MQIIDFIIPAGAIVCRTGGRAGAAVQLDSSRPRPAAAPATQLEVGDRRPRRRCAIDWLCRELTHPDAD